MRAIEMTNLQDEIIAPILMKGLKNYEAYFGRATHVI